MGRNTTSYFIKKSKGFVSSRMEHCPISNLSKAELKSTILFSGRMTVKEPVFPSQQTEQREEEMVKAKRGEASKFFCLTDYDLDWAV